jgi:hypothetical protein
MITVALYAKIIIWVTQLSVFFGVMSSDSAEERWLLLLADIIICLLLSPIFGRAIGWW